MLRTDENVVELSVFETGVPPRFRLYFFDRTETPVALSSGVTVTLETIRMGGSRQTFRFIPRGRFLESAAEIPGPHEFDVALNISHDGHTHTYRSKFTEEAHDLSHAGHDHSDAGHARSHGPGGHHHNHGTGTLGWVRGTFAHSHRIADKIDASMETHARGIWALKVGLLGLGITALFQLVIA